MEAAAPRKGQRHRTLAKSTGKNWKKLCMYFLIGIILIFLVGSNIILIRIIGTLGRGRDRQTEPARSPPRDTMNGRNRLHNSESLENEIHQWKQMWTNCTQSDHRCVGTMEIKKQLCVNTSTELSGCRLCPNGWLWHGESCYYYSAGGEYRTWNESREECDRMRAHLLVIEDPEQQDFLQKNSRVQVGHKFWIGVYRDGNGWRWVDGQIYNSDLIKSSGDFSGNCIWVEADAAYNRDDCRSKHRWICQKRALKM